MKTFFRNIILASSRFQEVSSRNDNSSKIMHVTYLSLGKSERMILVSKEKNLLRHYDNNLSSRVGSLTFFWLNATQC